MTDAAYAINLRINKRYDGIIRAEIEADVQDGDILESHVSSGEVNFWKVIHWMRDGKTYEYRRITNLEVCEAVSKWRS